MNEEDLMLDLPPALRKPAQLHGRAMVGLVYGAGICSEATAVLARGIQARQNGAEMHALQVLSKTFNQIFSSLLEHYILKSDCCDTFHRSCRCDTTRC